jgi:hypothetical protein
VDRQFVDGGNHINEFRVKSTLSRAYGGLFRDTPRFLLVGPSKLLNPACFHSDVQSLSNSPLPNKFATSMVSSRAQRSSKPALKKRIQLGVLVSEDVARDIPPQVRE